MEPIGSILKRKQFDEVSTYGSYLLCILNGYGFTHRHGAYTKPAVRKEVEVNNLLIPGGFGPPPLN